ncbi:aquaporin SIP1-1-like [Quillaja saponaria]|uniref:Aquaporin SIP1-1-like n=1 Tax=Quillaja saponaria TaxID=32244 RepID=A0AAD7KYT8_QUISA|nr:aquaporin SIP1-1-like [Quillaja saponaria]
MIVLKEAIGDAILTSIWVFSSSTLRFFTTQIAVVLCVQPISLPGFFITRVLVTILIFLNSWIDMPWVVPVSIPQPQFLFTQQASGLIHP